ncbi:MAG: hypothetical protein LC797_24540, partial [Chloroflexi bacterium]|nr:hypothetical protein [Chloroflexota bacterium]
MLHPSAITHKGQWRLPAAAALVAVVFVLAFGASRNIAQLTRPAVSSSASVSTLRSDVVTGGVSATDRQIGVLQERLRQQPSDQKSATQLGLAYLQRARETSDPTYYSRADGILNQALAEAPADPDTLIGLGTLALARHQFQDAVSWGRRAIAANDYKAAGYGVLGDAYTELGRYEDAVTTFQKMVDVRPDQTSYARVSYARELHGDMPGAISAM